jgi:hypothetical protein
MQTERQGQPERQGRREENHGRLNQDLMEWLRSAQFQVPLDDILRTSELCQSRDGTLNALHDPSPDIRLAAIRLLQDYWTPADDAICGCIKVACSDAESLVRGAAVALLMKLRFFVAEGNTTLRTQVDGLLLHLSGGEAEAVLDDDEWEREIDATLEACSAALEDLEQDWKKLAGPVYEQMVHSQEETIRYLSHEQRDVRMAALHVFCRRWNAPRRYGDVIANMAFHDADAEVRNMAVLALGNCYAGTDHYETGCQLATVVRDESKAIRFRLSAYRALFLLRGILDSDRMIFRVAAGQFDVDWAFVDSFRLNDTGPDEVN